MTGLVMINHALLLALLPIPAIAAVSPILISMLGTLAVDALAVGAAILLVKILLFKLRLIRKQLKMPMCSVCQQAKATDEKTGVCDSCLDFLTTVDGIEYTSETIEHADVYCWRCRTPPAMAVGGMDWTCPNCAAVNPGPDMGDDDEWMARFRANNPDYRPDDIDYDLLPGVICPACGSASVRTDSHCAYCDCGWTDLEPDSPPSRCNTCGSTDFVVDVFNRFACANCSDVVRKFG